MGAFLSGVLEVKALSLWQPWASAVGVMKLIETRHWSTAHRGELAIHAAKRLQADEREWWERLSRKDPMFPGTPPLGAIVSVARLVEVRPTEDLRNEIGQGEQSWGNYGDGRFGWVFADVRRLRQPVPCVGRQSLWTLDPETIALVREQMR